MINCNEINTISSHNIEGNIFVLLKNTSLIFPGKNDMTAAKIKKNKISGREIQNP